MLTDISKEDFTARYLLGRQVAQEGVRSYEGRDTEDRRVLVHLLGPVEGPQAVPWLAALGALTPERRSGLIGAFRVDGEAILVTEHQDHVSSLAEWFVATAGGKKVTNQTSPSPTSDTSGEMGAAAYHEAAEPGRVDETEGTTAESPAHAADSAPESGAGEFTRLFAPETQGTAKTPRDNEVTEIIPRVVDSDKTQPQEADPGHDQAQQSSQEQGEFTRMFGAKQKDTPEQTLGDPGEHKPPTPSGETATAGAASDEGGAGTGGEFTRVFGAQETAGTERHRPQPRDQRPSPSSSSKPQVPPQQRDEERKGRPRIVWRDQKSKSPGPEPKRADAKASPRPAEAKPSPPPITPPKPTGQEKAPPKRPEQEQPPGQFTEIFGRDLLKESESSRPETDRQPQSDRSMGLPAEDRSLHYDTEPRTPASGRPPPLSGQGSDDYLRALGSDSQVEPPKPAPTPEPEGRQHEHHPDLPPPVSKPRQESAPGPGDYTRVISGGSASPQQSAAPSPAPPPAPTPAPAPASSAPKDNGEAATAKVPVWLWVVLAAIVLLMILLVVIVVLT